MSSGVNMLKTASVVVGVLAVLLGAAIGYGQLQGTVEDTEEKVAEVKEEVKEVEDKAEENENINIAQTVLLEQLSKTVDLLNQKVDKELSE